MKRTIRAGISTCPNDTFLFHALLAGEVRIEGLELVWELADIEQLNEHLLSGRLDLAKASIPAVLARGAELALLPCGAALGFGVGPLLLGASGRRLISGRIPPGARVLCPGEWTTATALLRLLHPESPAPAQTVFSAILPELASGRADFGVCIHEARFTWREHGLERCEDLGQTWERLAGTALPLGGIAVRKDLGQRAAQELARAVQASLDWALAHREACLPTMRRYAQEHSDAVLWSHVELYVNAWTRELGSTGRAALAAFAERARAAGLVKSEDELEIVRADLPGNDTDRGAPGADREA